MTLSLTRVGIASMAGSALLSLALIGSAAAQVATLSEPDPDAEQTAAPLADELDGEEALLEWAQCMRDSGIDMDDPQFGTGSGRFGLGPGGADAAVDPLSTEFQTAMDECGDVLEALRPETDPQAEAERAEQQLVIAECMRDLGWDFPDPATGGGFGTQIRFIQEADIDPQDPAFQTDISACQAESGLDLGPPGARGGVAD